VNVALCSSRRTDKVAGAYQFTATSAVEALENASLVADWRRVIGAGRTRDTMFMSPEWIAHLASRSDASIMIWFARDSRDELVGVVPVAQREFKLTYDVANRVLWKKSLRVAEVLGSEPCLPDDHTLLRSIFEGILDAWPDCDGVLFDALPTDCFCSQAILAQEEVMPGLVYSPFDDRPTLVVPIGASFDDYMRTKSPKTRSKLRKLQSIIDSGRIRTERYSNPADVMEFAAGVSLVSARTWQNRLLGLQYRNDEKSRENFCDLADRGLLRSYLLWRDDQPVAYVVGYQFDGVYYYADIGFDPQAAELSPGTVLLFMILQDLHESNPPTVLNFGVGDAAYKQRFGKTVGRDEAILLLRRELRNRLLIFSHQSFMLALNAVKRLIGREVRT
jgi:hypothetical protein